MYLYYILLYIYLYVHYIYIYTYKFIFKKKKVYVRIAHNKLHVGEESRVVHAHGAALIIHEHKVLLFFLSTCLLCVNPILCTSF